MLRKLAKVKRNFLILLVLASLAGKSQTIDSFYVNLYTDSLKKGTYNYINVDGKCSNGSYLPLDSTHLIFTSSEGKFYGNSLWLDKNFTAEKVHIKVTLRKNPALTKEFDIWIKTKEDEDLKTTEEILRGN